MQRSEKHSPMSDTSDFGRTGWLSRYTATGDTARLGPLEWQVLQTMWTRNTPTTVVDIHRDHFASAAYTTVMTTMDRLFQKGLLERTKQGRGYLYRAKITEAEFQTMRAVGALQSALKSGPVQSATPILTGFVKAVGNRDLSLLDKLADLVKAARNRRSE